MAVFAGQNRDQLRRMYLDTWRKFSNRVPLEPLEAQVAAVIAVVVNIYRFAGEVFGPNFTKERFPLAGAFFDKVRIDSAVGVGPIKQAYKRSRPFQANADVKPPANIAAASQSPTYPSGDSTSRLPSSSP